MVDRHRCETPGAWHHVMNRGVARRTVVEGERDAGVFLGGLRRVVEEGLLEVHAYCLMGSHFHMLVRSPRGELARAMMLTQNLYSRWFNRTRRRDGPLWRGRFLSKLVQSEAYWRVLVRYIDHNPVRAGVVTSPDSYPYGSALHYARRRAGPAWLTRREIEETVRAQVGARRYEPRDYHRVFGERLSRSAHWMVDHNGFARADVEETFAGLVAAAPEQVRAWMRRKAELADGTATIGVGMLDPDVLLTSLAMRESEEPAWTIRPGRQRKSGWRALRCALLHHVSGCTTADIAIRVGAGASTVGRHLREHPGLILADAGYEQRCGEVLSRLVAAEYGGCR